MDKIEKEETEKHVRLKKVAEKRDLIEKKINKNGKKRDFEAIERRKHYWRSYREDRNENDNENEGDIDDERERKKEKEEAENVGVNTLSEYIGGQNTFTFKKSVLEPLQTVTVENETDPVTTLDELASNLNPYSNVPPYSDTNVHTENLDNSELSDPSNQISNNERILPLNTLKVFLRLRIRDFQSPQKLVIQGKDLS